MACERTLVDVGSVDHFRHFIALHRPKPKREAYLRLRLTREQSKSTGGIRTLEIGRAHRALMDLSWYCLGRA